MSKMLRQKPLPSPKFTIGNNPERSRTHNRRVVLDVIRQNGPLGRTAIARLTHLSSQAVSNIISELLEEGLLLECGRLRSGRGQPPVQVMVNPEGGMTIGIEIAADHMVTVLVDLTGRIRAQQNIALRDTDPEHIVPLLKMEIAQICSSIPDASERLLGVGVVMPGPFEIDGMSSVGPTTLPGWSGHDAQAMLTAALGISTLVENDATAAAVGERLHGAAKNLKNYCLLYFGAGLGLGIVADGRPLRGAFGNAGEIGHFVVSPGGRACACGNQGCLERYASLHSLEERLRAAGLTYEIPVDLDALRRAHHPILQDWITETANYLAPVIGMLENLLDPESIIIGGALPHEILADLIKALAPLPRSVASRRHRMVPRILPGTTGLLTAALGAAALPLLETMTPKLDTAPA